MKPESLIEPRAGERIVEIVREDFIPALPWWGLLFIWITTPFFFLVPLIQRGAEGVFFLSVLLLTGVFMFWRTYFVWQHTLLIITNQRTIDVSQRGFFDRTVAEVEWRDVLEVKYRVKGLWSTVFRYGTIYLRTAGERPDLAFRRVHRPIELYHLLNDLLKVCRH